ncbi:AfsA-related hotdog domain-containing protein [Streptomyces noursei]|uniref:Adhesin n=1 Tax=Streptomyces noursei TaxID=1971 RepID=A0A401QRD2_STRNR|nr:AfsA-related hotdog domain-containing protein [Streptomyces noursei]GCB87960.1 adhesin [Streptomyces noursei]
MPAPLAVPVASLPEAASDLGPLVRKRVSDEVLITDWRTVSGTTHHVTAHWPQHHSFYTPRSGRYSSLLLVETVRQALALLSNAAYEVPLEYRLGWTTARAPSLRPCWTPHRTVTGRRSN